jgi:hypothetical protein
VDLRQLHFGNKATRFSLGHGNQGSPLLDDCLFFNADVYFATSYRRYRKVLSFNKVIILQVKGLKGDMYQRTVIKGLTDFITAICAAEKQTYSVDTLTIDEDSIRKNVTLQSWRA